MIEYLNNPALLILALEMIVFLLVMNGVLFFLLSKRSFASFLENDENLAR